MARKPAPKNKKVVKKEEKVSESEKSGSETLSQEDIVESESTVADSKDVEAANELVQEVDVSDSDNSNGEDSEEKVVGGEDSSSVSEETKSGSEEGPAVDDETMRTIFIKGLDYDNTEEQLRTEMEKIGPVGRVHVPMTHDTRRNKGFAYVEFVKLADAKKGLKLNGSTFLGRTIIVDQAKPKGNFMLYTVFCKNLSFDTTKEELMDHFSKYGKIHNLSLPMDSENEGRNRGFCFIEYKDEAIANKVLDDKHVINNRKLYLNMGNKNDDRNRKRANDRLYGRRDNNGDGRRGGYGNRGGNDSRGPRRDDERPSKKTFYDDE